MESQSGTNIEPPGVLLAISANSGMYLVTGSFQIPSPTVAKKVSTVKILVILPIRNTVLVSTFFTPDELNSGRFGAVQ